MLFRMNDGLNILIPALAVFRERMVEEKVPDIVFPQFVYVDQSGGAGLMNKMHFEVSSASDLDNGLVGDKTTSLDTVEVNFKPGDAPIVSWTKSASWTLRELEVCSRLKIDVNTEKLRVLRQNADQTLQKVAFVGHGKDKRIKGLLNGEGIAVKPAKVAKSFEDMTGDEAVAVFVDMFKAALDSTNLIAAPDTLAMPLLDYVEIATKERGTGRDTSVLEYVSEKLAAAAGKAVALKPIPLRYADKAGVGGKKRMIAYINDQQHVVYDVPVSPEVLDPHQKSITEWDVAMRMDFGGVTWLEKQSATYIDY